jgi:hypothetical protein
VGDRGRSWRAAEALIADAPGGTWSVRDLTVRIYDLHTDPTEPQLRTVRRAVRRWRAAVRSR